VCEKTGQAKGSSENVPWCEYLIFWADQNIAFDPIQNLNTVCLREVPPCFHLHAYWSRLWNSNSVSHNFTFGSNTFIVIFCVLLSWLFYSAVGFETLFGSVLYYTTLLLQWLVTLFLKNMIAFFILPNPSSRTITLRLTQSLNRNEYRQHVSLTTSPPSVSRVSRQCRILNNLQPCGPQWPVTGIASFLYFTFNRLIVNRIYRIFSNLIRTRFKVSEG
jgi:hypothetical protein